MVVDPRRDHSFRVPRPALEAALGAPIACAACHEDQETAWFVSAIESNRDGEAPPPHPFAEAFALSEWGHPGGRAALLAVAENEELDGFVRGSALSRLANGYEPLSGEPLARALADADPFVRLGALANTQSFPQRDLLRITGPLVHDPIRAVRLEAARQLAGVPTGLMTEDMAAAFRTAFDEYEAVQTQHGDRAASMHNLGNVTLARGDTEGAIGAYQTAIARDPAFVPAYVNLADLKREQGDEAAALETLEDGVEVSPSAAVLHYALGLALARGGDAAGAEEHLAQAADLAPSNPHYRYVGAVALHSGGQVDVAMERLEGIARDFPYHEDTRIALATMERDRGNFKAALRHGQYLVEMWPNRPEYRQLVEQLQQLARTN